MKVRVKFFTTLRELVGKREEEFEFDQPLELVDVLELLADRYGPKARDYLFEGGRVRDFLQLLINGISATALKGLKTEVKDGDVIAIIPPVGGGSYLRCFNSSFNRSRLLKASFPRP